MRSPLFRLCLFSCLLGVLSLNLAVADESNDGSVAVSFNDLNLANPDGLESLNERIEYAAHKACGVENFKVSLDIERENRECVSHTIDKTNAKLDDAGLTAKPKPKLVAGIIGS